LIIDPKIRDWVLIPIIVVMFFVGVFRFYLNQYMTYNKTPEKPNKTVVKEHGNKNVIAMCQKLIQNFLIIPETAFRMRKSYFCKKTKWCTKQIIWQFYPKSYGRKHDDESFNDD